LNFNYVTETLLPGQHATVQGGGFTTKTRVNLQAINSAGQSVGIASPPIINRDANVLQISIPTTFSTSLYAVWLTDDQGNSSVTRYINQANGIRFNTDAIAPGNTLEVWGRNLGGFAGAVSSVSFVSSANLTYTSTATQADNNHLAAVVPAALTPGATYQVYVSNGLGGAKGWTQVNVPLTIRKAGPDNAQLGVPWAADFTYVPGNYKNAANTYNVKTDARLTLHAYGDGLHDDEAAIQNALNVASLDPAGGGIVYLPAGTYLLVTSPAKVNMYLSMQPHVVLTGDGPGLTLLRAAAGANAGVGLVNFYQVTLGGIANLTLQNLGQGNQTLHVGAPSSTNNISEIFLKNVDFQLGNGLKAMLTDITDLAVLNCSFESTETTYDPWGFFNDPYMLLQGNTFNYRVGRMHIQGSDYAILRNNTFTRDGAYSYPGAWETGAIEASTAFIPVISNNQFSVTAGALGGNNDGEMVLTQDVGLTPYFRDTGTLTSATSLSVGDSTKSWPVPSGAPGDQIIVITTGIAAGQWRYVTAMTANTVSVDHAWDFIPPAGSHYSLTGWMADRVFVLNNTFNNSVRSSVELYDGAWYSTISGNTVVMTNTTQYANDVGGIWLRASDRTMLPSETGAGYVVKHDPAWNTVISGNTIRYSGGAGMVLQVMLAQVNGPLHGFGMLNTEVRNNLMDNECVNAQGVPILQSGWWTWGYWIGGMVYGGPQDMVNSSAIDGLILEGNSGINLAVPLYNLGDGLGQTIAQ
jgi:hypothetical protein